METLGSSSPSPSSSSKRPERASFSSCPRMRWASSPGGLAGERHPEDLFGAHQLVGHQPDDAVGHGGGLAGPGAGDHQQRFQRRRDDRGLLGGRLVLAEQVREFLRGVDAGRRPARRRRFPAGLSWGGSRLGHLFSFATERTNAGQPAAAAAAPAAGGIVPAQEVGLAHQFGGLEHHGGGPVLVDDRRLGLLARALGVGAQLHQRGAGRPGGQFLGGLAGERTVDARRPGRRRAAGGVRRPCRWAVTCRSSGPRPRGFRPRRPPPGPPPRAAARRACRRGSSRRTGFPARSACGSPRAS